MSSVLVRAASGLRRSGSVKIERVSREEEHTLVIKQGGQQACLRFTETILVEKLLEYCEAHLGWQVKNLPFVVEGERYAAQRASTVELQPDTEEVHVGMTTKPTILEITRDVGAKG